MTSSRSVALITGGTTGIGLATARVLHERGLDVLVTGNNPETIAAAQRALPKEIVVIRADARSLADADKTVAELRARFGKLDTAFLNAGIGKMLPIEAVDEATFDEHFAVNVKGQFFLLQKILPLMSAGGSVIFNCAVGAYKGVPNWSVYTATKGALMAMVRALAVELAPRGIRVNSVSPGPIDNAAFQKLGLPPETMSAFRKLVPERVPLGRFGLDEEIAGAVAFLASSAASFVNGIDLRVDGGMAAS
ncbi:SDR family oxidoreductase [Dongia deserti]|uniref:SDR family oxidoreductase n=1 Tax=Dongia deserti TaxID=2268030 RepID=UPI000E65C6E4|nr:SDR family oxidoreductase [Dongia deserti]